MLAERYAEAARAAIDKIERTQMDNIRRAGDAIAAALANGGAFWLYRIGHGGDMDFLHRAGGLMAARSFSFRFEVSSPVPEALKGRPRPQAVDAELEAVRLAVRSSEMRSGDALMLASVSGRNRVPVELALAAREIGVSVIGLTSTEYTSRVESLHPSGRKLCDVADIVIDSCAPFGDACVEVPGYEHRALPISGLTHIAIGWMVCAAAIERMLALGKQPHIYQSVNRPGGVEYNQRAEAEYEKLGY
jgi:uncharacterized phosphosugar-binding protein